MRIRQLFVFATLLVLAFSDVSRATSFIPPGSTTTWVTNGDSYFIGTNESFYVGRWDTGGAILNQTGGTITVGGTWGSYRIGDSAGGGGWGIYNMSGTGTFNAANLSGADSGNGIYHILGRNGSKLTMTDNAVANIASLSLESYSGAGAKIELSGSANLTVGNKSLSIDSNSFITFASGCSATVTVTCTHNYTNLVNAGSIRVDGSTAIMAEFNESGNSLSLKPVFTDLDHFDISAISSPQTAGVPVSITITAKKSDESTLTTYTGAGNAVDFFGTAGVTGTSADFVNGVLSSVSVTPTVAGTNRTFYVYGGGRIGTSTFDVNIGAASKLGFGVQPGTTPPGFTISPAVTVLVQDSCGNTVTGDTSSVTISSGNTAFSGDSILTTNAVAGVATFSSIKPTTQGSGKTLTASDGSLASATSTTFNVDIIVINGSFIPPGSTTTTVTYGYAYFIGTNQSFWIGRFNTGGAILNQSGGTITVGGTWGNFMIGENPNGWGIYNMSSNAVFAATNLNGASAAYTFTINGYNGSKMTMTNDASANIGSLTFGSYGGWGHVDLSGNASLTVGVMGYSGNWGFGSGYISFTSGSTATLTITGKVLADYQTYVTAGSIRVNGVVQSDFSKFQVTGSTLSLKPSSDCVLFMFH